MGVNERLAIRAEGQEEKSLSVPTERKKRSFNISAEEIECLGFFSFGVKML